MKDNTVVSGFGLLLYAMEMLYIVKEKNLHSGLRMLKLIWDMLIYLFN